MNTFSPTASIVSFDARTAIARGEEPLSDILALAETIKDGDMLEIIAPFDPKPLYIRLGALGFVMPPSSIERAPGEWRTAFRRVAIAPTQTVASVQSVHPATTRVFAEFGLDACCGGAHTLAVAAGAHGVELAHLLARLEAAALGRDDLRVNAQGNP